MELTYYKCLLLTSFCATFSPIKILFNDFLALIPIAVLLGNNNHLSNLVEEIIE